MISEGKRISDRRCRAETGELQVVILGQAEMRPIEQPDQERADERPQELGDDVGRNPRPFELADDRERDGHRRVDVRTAEGGDGEDGDEHGHAPAPGDDDPSRILSLGAGEDDVGNHPVAEKNENGRTDDFAEKRVHDFAPACPRYRYWHSGRVESAGGHPFCLRLGAEVGVDFLLRAIAEENLAGFQQTG